MRVSKKEKQSLKHAAAGNSAVMPNNGRLKISERCRTPLDHGNRRIFTSSYDIAFPTNSILPAVTQVW